MTKFNVLLYGHSCGDNYTYDVLPYFRHEWKDENFYYDDSFKRQPVRTKDDLKRWVESRSSYMYRARCQYECMLASWPFGSKRMNDQLKAFLETNPTFDRADDHIRLGNIIMRDMYKIDVHEQVMMNIEVITDILAKEFKIE